MQKQEHNLFSQEQLREIFDRAVEIPSGQHRKNYLESACQGDDTLRQRIETLLLAHDSAGSFLESPIDPFAEGLITKLLPLTEAEHVSATDLGSGVALSEGDEVGAYILEKRIGEGGFGIVYSGVHRDIKRRVAVKLIKPGMDTRHVIARFNRERISLSVMNHAGIARIYEAGSTGHGLPYFIMELVNGSTIMSYCDDHNLSVKQRIEMLVVVCDAIAHAHQKGVIHRDLKPGNILVEHVDGGGVPKVIDFGISKTSELICGNPSETGSAQLMGTPLYMSPEQASFENYDIDVRADVYALGVLLYELVAGSPPALEPGEDAGNVGLILQRTRAGNKVGIRQRLQSLGESTGSEIAKHRATSFDKLIHCVSDDLESVAAKALQTDRDLRYDSVSALAKDLRNILNNTPVEARPASLLYRSRKFYQRNTTSVLLASAAVAAMLVASWFSIWFVMRAHRAELLADAAVAEKQMAVAGERLASAAKREHQEDLESIELLLSNMFSAVLAENLGPNVTLTEVLLSQRKSIDRAFQDNPELRDKLGLKAAQFFSQHAPRDEVVDNLQAMLEASENVLEPSGTEINNAINLRHRLAQELVQIGQLQKAATISREVTEALSQEANKDKLVLRFKNLNLLARIEQSSGQFEKAIEMYKECESRATEALGHDHLVVLQNSASLVHAYLKHQRFRDAEEQLLKVQDVAKGSLPMDHPINISFLVASASIHLARRDLDHALKSAREAVHYSGNANGRNTATYARHLRFNARVELEAGNFDEAIDLDQRSLEIAIKSGNATLDETLDRYLTLAQNWTAKGEAAKGHRAQQIQCFGNALAIASEHFPPNSQQTIFLEARLAFLNSVHGAQASINQLEEILHRATLHVGKQCNGTINIMRTLSSLYCQEEEFKKAEVLLLEALELSKKLNGDAHPFTLHTLASYAQSLRCQDCHRECLAILNQWPPKLVNIKAPKTYVQKQLVELYRWSFERDSELKLQAVFSFIESTLQQTLGISDISSPTPTSIKAFPFPIRESR